MATEVLVRSKVTGKLEWVDKAKADLLPGRDVCVQTYTEVKPFYSTAVACHPADVADMNAWIKELGLAASLHHEPDGRLRCTSRGALNEYLQERGLMNADASYGDYAGA